LFSCKKSVQGVGVDISQCLQENGFGDTVALKERFDVCHNYRTSVEDWTVVGDTLNSIDALD